MVDGGYRMMESEEGEGGDERMSDPSGRMVSHSTSVSSPASDSPTPTNSVHEKTWGQAHTHWHGLSKISIIIIFVVNIISLAQTEQYTIAGFLPIGHSFSEEGCGHLHTESKILLTYHC